MDCGISLHLEHHLAPSNAKIHLGMCRCSLCQGNPVTGLNVLVEVTPSGAKEITVAEERQCVSADWKVSGEDSRRKVCIINISTPGGCR